MSRVYFHSKEHTAELRGTERHYMGMLCNDLTLSAVGSIRHARDWLSRLLPEEPWALESDYSFRLWLVGGASTDTFTIDGDAVSVFDVALNTAWDLGNDQVRLLARLHGQCEIHCWVDGPNRRWLSEIIRAGRKTNVLRSGQGWESVANLLESRDDGPVVCSYSVCEMFPNFESLPKGHPLKNRDDEERYDDFYEIPHEECWDACIAGLRARGTGLELRPDDWADFRFRGRHSIFSLRERTAP